MELIIGILASQENEVVGEILDNLGNYVGAVICKSSEEKDILKCFEESYVNLIILAGYTKRISDDFISKYPGRILNIHPSLLPKFGGKGMYGRAVHEAVIASGDEKSGATIHIVEGDYDVGKIVSEKILDQN